MSEPICSCFHCTTEATLPQLHEDIKRLEAMLGAMMGEDDGYYNSSRDPYGVYCLCCGKYVSVEPRRIAPPLELCRNDECPRGQWREYQEERGLK